MDSTLVKAIARAFRWQKMLETGRYATIREIAKAERINPSYVSRVLRLTLLAPATVEAILDGWASTRGRRWRRRWGCFRWNGDFSEALASRHDGRLRTTLRLAIGLRR